MTAARRLAAILAADVVGYSRLMGEDEAGTARAVSERREAACPIIAAYGGRIVKTMGDGLLLEFPSIVATVECAIAIQRLMTERNAVLAEDKRILYRIGVNLGDVLVEGDDILGDGVNIAARLEGIAEPGRICLSRAAYDHVLGKIEAKFVDLGERDLKNIARPMRVYAIRPDSESVSPAPSASAPNRLEPPRLSIVVLPFANMTGDPEHEYFVDGVTESLTTDLSRISGSFVIGRNTAFTYKGRPFDVKTIGRELNVRYVLEGSIQRGGNRMRVNVQLLDAESGNHLWAERFDKPLADLFDMQDEIVARLANALTVPLVAAEARRAERTPSPDPMDLCFQGRALRNKGLTYENLEKARGLFEQAVGLDPGNALGLIGVAVVDIAVALSYFPDDRAARLNVAEANLNKALSFAPDNANAHLGLGIVQIWTHRAYQGIRECERALELNRNLANALGHMGAAKVQLGHPEDTEAHVREALRLSPRDTQVYLWCVLAGAAKLHLGKEEEAVVWLHRSVESKRNYATSHFVLAAALAGLEQLTEARSEVRTGVAVTPSFTISRFFANLANDNPNAVAGWERLIDDMRKAGVPEQ